MIHIRYVLARPEEPKDPKLVGSGLRVSHDKKQDIKAEDYKQACEVRNEEMSTQTYEHLLQRDRYAWTYTLEFPVADGEAESIAREFSGVTRSMRHIKRPPGRNAWACHNLYCDWMDLCHADPSGDVTSWWGVGENDYSKGRSYRLRKAAKFPDSSYPIGKYKKIIDRGSTGKAVSPSELKTFLSCQRKWWFEFAKQSRVLVEYTKMSARARGTFCHKAAEIYHDSGANGVTSFYSWADEWLEERKMEAPPHWYDSLRVCWKTGRELYLLATHDMDEVLYTEAKLGYVLPGTKTWMICQPDIICRKGNDIYVIDYKTSGQKRLDKVAETYRNSPSMYLYALAVERGYLLEEIPDV